MGDTIDIGKGMVVGGRYNNYGSKPWEQSYPPGALSYAFSFTPPQQQHGQYPHSHHSLPYQKYPPEPPYQHTGYGCAPQMAGGGHGYYGGGYHHGQGYPDQYLPPNPGGYNYGVSHNCSGAQHKNMGSSILPNHGGSAATGVPVYGHGQHDTVNKQLGQDHGEAHVLNKEGSSAASGAVTAGAGAAANGGHGKHDAVNKHPHHEQSPGGHTTTGGAAAAAHGHHGHGGLAASDAAAAGAGAAANGGYGKHDAVNKHPHHEQSPGGHTTTGGAAAAAYGYHGHGYYGGSHMAGGGHGYYGSSQMPGGGHGQDYPGQYWPPNEGGYNYGGHGKHDAVNKHPHHEQSPGGHTTTGGAAAAAYGYHGHGYYGGSHMAGGGHGYYGGGYNHGQGYPGQYWPPNQGGYNYGGHGKHDAVNMHAYEHNHGGGHMATGVAASAGASALYSHG